jgi:nucleotide-binding universal stress UspA family protein
MAAGPDGGERRIVVGVDGSRHSQNALLWAVHFATIFSARLDVVGAWEYPQSFGWAAIAPEWDPAKDTEKVLEDTVRAVTGDRPAGTQLLVREGGAAKVLLDASAGATILVVGSRGHGGFAGLLLGSVSANVAEHAPCPVFIVHGDKTTPQRA